MAGWRKAWLSVLDRSGGGGGGSSGSLQAHLHGILSLSPSSSSSSLAATSYNNKRASGGGGKYGGVSSKAVLACFSVVLVFAFFYVSVTRGPTADDSFPTPTASSSSSSGALLSWLSSSNSSSSSKKKPLPPHPPVPPTTVSSSTGIAQQSSACNETVAVQGNADDSAPAVDSGQPVPEQTAKDQGFLRDAGNATIVESDLDREHVTNGTNAQEATAMPTQPWWRADGANSSVRLVVGEPADSDGNSTDTVVVSSGKEDRNANASSVDNVLLPKSTRQAVVIPSTSPPDQRKDDRHRRKRAAMARRRHHSTRRRKEMVLPVQEESAAWHSDGANTSEGVGPGNHRVVWTSGMHDLVSFAKCDLFSGSWVREESYALYPPRSCPHIDDDFNCHKNGRQDTGFLNWRWQPSGCDIPRMNVTDFLERLRGQRIIFVGDSLGRNMWESLVCILRHGVKNKKSVYERSGRNQFKTRGYYSFKFRDYNCSVDFIRSIFLVKELVRESKTGTVLDAKLRLDELDATTPAYQTADIVVFNTGHWWTHAKTSKGLNYYQEGNHVHRSLEVMDAYRRGLTTWARWVDNNIDSRRTQVVFRGYSLTHFRGGQWNSGGRCHRETEPIFNQSYLTEYPVSVQGAVRHGGGADGGGHEAGLQPLVPAGRSRQLE